MFAGRSAGPLFHKKVTIEGADEDLSFNIAIPLPTPPQGIINKHVCIMIFFYIVAPPTTTDSVTTPQGIINKTVYTIKKCSSTLYACRDASRNNIYNIFEFPLCLY